MRYGGIALHHHAPEVMMSRMAHRPRCKPVQSRFSSRELRAYVTTGLALGIATSAAGLLANRALLLTRLWYPVWFELAVAAIYLIPLVLMMVVIARRVFSFGSYFRAALMLGSGFAIGAEASIAFEYITEPHKLGERLAWSAISIVATFLGAITIALVCFVIRSPPVGARRLIIAEGEHCGYCGYLLEGLAGDAACPECGVEPAGRVSGRRAGKFVGLLARLAPFAACVLIAAPLLHAWRSIAAAGAARDYFGVLVKDGEIRTSYLWQSFAVIPSEALAVVVRNELLGERVILVIRPRSPSDALPALRLELSIFGIVGDADSLMTVDPPVRCDLDETQALFVTRHGIPDSLVRAISEAAQGSVDPAVTLMGGITKEYRVAYSGGEPVFIDPTPFLQEP